MTQSDVSTPADAAENSRSALAAGKERSGRGAATAQTSAVAAQLAELEEVDPRAVFQRDGAGFADWLAVNLDQLAKELGVSGLREVGRDVGVGSFTVDVLAQTDRGRRVAITTQLEPSDHPQLGQMITFAAGSRNRNLPRPTAACRRCRFWKATRLSSRSASRCRCEVSPRRVRRRSSIVMRARVSM